MHSKNLRVSFVLECSGMRIPEKTLLSTSLPQFSHLDGDSTAPPMGSFYGDNELTACLGWMWCLRDPGHWLLVSGPLAPVTALMVVTGGAQCGD